MTGSRYLATGSLLVVLVLLLVGCKEPAQPVALESLPGVAATSVYSDVIPAALTYDVPSHPFLAPQGVNSMHADGYSSDVHPVSGPRGQRTKIVSRKGSRSPGGQCATVTFTESGNLLALCTGLSGFRINLLAPRSLELLAEYKLGVRPSTYQSLLHFDKRYIMEDSSGAYFYLDNKDRVVIAGSDHVLRRIVHRQDTKGQWRFYIDGQWNLGEYAPSDCMRPSNPFPQGECDPITAVMPDYDGLIWWVTRAGRVGSFNVDTGLGGSLELDGEEIQNGFSVAEDGVYIVSDHALYSFAANQKDEPRIQWREAYDRGSFRKVGTINQGSGTTPTLFGDYIAIADNADERINLLVYKRGVAIGGNRLLCKRALFTKGESVSDNSMIALGRSIVVENNFGFVSAYQQKDWNEVAGGIVRLDLREDETDCDVVWESSERIPSVVPKLAAKDGTVYFYTFEEQPDGVNAWYLIGLDFYTGKTLFRIHTGNGKAFNNNWSPITLAPDGTAYIGTLGGIVAVWDDQ